ncbi:MAG TPA: trypsin-like peptidase domain-containing protein [Blastocatellia bacterium]
MYERSEPAARQPESYPTSRPIRLIITLIAITCLSIGIAVGAMVQEIARARSEDNRLTISSTVATPDALSATFARVSRDVEPCVAHIKVFESEVYAREGAGSGVIVNSAGFILTNAHVVRRANKIRVKLSDGTETDAKVIGVDTQTDLAVIKIAVSKPLPVARMGDSDKLSVGDWVLAIGSPFGLEQTVTAGIISAKDRVTGNDATPFQQFLQTDAAINPGNSGGPLVSLAGEVIGINTQIATNTGAYNGIGFALPSSTAVEIYNQLATDGRVRRGFLGIAPQEITPQITRLNNIPSGQGVVVKDLTSETSPAARAGLQSGDVITTVNGQKVATTRELIRRIAALPVGSVADIEYVRAGQRHIAKVKLEERNDSTEDPLNVRPIPLPRSPRRAPENDDGTQRKSKSISGLGANVKTLTPELARTQGLEGARGAFVFSVEPGSLADENNLTADDLIVEANNRPIASQEDFLRFTQELNSGNDVVLKVLRKERGPLRRAWIISFTMP